MESTLLESCPLDIQELPPETVFVVRHPATSTYGCLNYEGIDGLATFTTEGAACKFTDFINLSGMCIEDTAIMDALGIASKRPAPVTALFVFKHLSEPPRIFYVKSECELSNEMKYDRNKQ